MIQIISAYFYSFKYSYKMFIIHTELNGFNYQAAVVSILLYGCTTWKLTKRLKKKLDGNYTRMHRAILNKSWRQHPTRHQLYGRLPPVTKTIQVRRTRHAGEAGTSSSVIYSYGPPHMAKQKQDEQLVHTYSSYVRI